MSGVAQPLFAPPVASAKDIAAVAAAAAASSPSSSSLKKKAACAFKEDDEADAEVVDDAADDASASEDEDEDEAAADEAEDDASASDDEEEEEEVTKVKKPAGAKKAADDVSAAQQQSDNAAATQQAPPLGPEIGPNESPKEHMNRLDVSAKALLDTLYDEKNFITPEFVTSTKWKSDSKAPPPPMKINAKALREVGLPVNEPVFVDSVSVRNLHNGSPLSLGVRVTGVGSAVPVTKEGEALNKAKGVVPVKTASAPQILGPTGERYHFTMAPKTTRTSNELTQLTTVAKPVALKLATHAPNVLALPADMRQAHAGEISVGANNVLGMELRRQAAAPKRTPQSADELEQAKLMDDVRLDTVNGEARVIAKAALVRDLHNMYSDTRLSPLGLTKLEDVSFETHRLYPNAEGAFGSIEGELHNEGTSAPIAGAPATQHALQANVVLRVLKPEVLRATNAAMAAADKAKEVYRLGKEARKLQREAVKAAYAHDLDPDAMRKAGWVPATSVSSSNAQATAVNSSVLLGGSGAVAQVVAAASNATAAATITPKFRKHHEERITAQGDSVWVKKVGHK